MVWKVYVEEVVGENERVVRGRCDPKSRILCGWNGYCPGNINEKGDDFTRREFPFRIRVSGQGRLSRDGLVMWAGEWVSGFDTKCLIK